MPSFTAAFVTLAVVAGAAVAAPIAAVVERGAPANWAYGYLEPYNTYHTRYIALECQNQHNTTFFEDCCHPLLSTQSLSDRADYCTPNATQIAAAAASSTAPVSASSALADAASAYSSASVASTSVVGDVAFATKTSTSVYVAPTSTYVAPTSTYVAPTTSKAAAPTTTAASSGGGSGQTMTGGFATYFYQNGNAGECGSVHSDSDYGIAIDSNGWWGDYASNSNSPHCGKQIRITNTNNGKSVTATVWDVCPTCVSNNSLDLSVAAFNAIASPSEGLVPISWQWA